MIPIRAHISLEENPIRGPYGHNEHVAVTSVVLVPAFNYWRANAAAANIRSGLVIESAEGVALKKDGTPGKSRRRLSSLGSTDFIQTLREVDIQNAAVIIRSKITDELAALQAVLEELP